MGLNRETQMSYFSVFHLSGKKNIINPTFFSLLEFQNCQTVLRFWNTPIFIIKFFQCDHLNFIALYTCSLSKRLSFASIFISLNDFIKSRQSWYFNETAETSIKSFKLWKINHCAIKHSLVCKSIKLGTKYMTAQSPWKLWKHTHNLAEQARMPSNSRIKCYLWHER